MSVISASKTHLSVSFSVPQFNELRTYFRGYMLSTSNTHQLGVLFLSLMRLFNKFENTYSLWYQDIFPPSPLLCPYRGGCTWRTVGSVDNIPFPTRRFQNPSIYDVIAIPPKIQYMLDFLQECSHLVLPGDPNKRRTSNTIYQALLQHTREENNTKIPTGKLATNTVQSTLSTGYSTFRMVPGTPRHNTNERQTTYDKTDTAQCATCQVPGTLKHKLTECEVTEHVWTWLTTN